jgi:hypothetical protein
MSEKHTGVLEQLAAAATLERWNESLHNTIMYLLKETRPVVVVVVVVVAAAARTRHALCYYFGTCSGRHSHDYNIIIIILLLEVILKYFEVLDREIR